MRRRNPAFLFGRCMECGHASAQAGRLVAGGEGVARQRPGRAVASSRSKAGDPVFRGPVMTATLIMYSLRAEPRDSRRERTARRANQHSAVHSNVQKYIRSPLPQIKSITRAVLCQTRGVAQRHETWCGMRWTRTCCGRTARTRTAKSCGPDASTLASSQREVSRWRRCQESPITGESTV
jgi:hypothetical protein